MKKMPQWYHCGIIWGAAFGRSTSMVGGGTAAGTAVGAEGWVVSNGSPEEAAGGTPGVALK